MQTEAVIAEFGKWRVRELQLSPEKLTFIWGQIQTYKSLFSDLTRGDPRNFQAILTDPNTFWSEVLDDKDQLLGIMYLTNVQWVTDADVHIVFFDRDLAEKAPLCREAIKWLFENFPFRRLTATIPAIYFATIRLARKIGFKEEGRKREALLIGNKWVDHEILGILRTEVL